MKCDECGSSDICPRWKHSDKLCVKCCECDDCLVAQKEWCEVGEHYVDPDDMWEDFADCKNCVSEKEYKEAVEKN